MSEYLTILRLSDCKTLILGGGMDIALLKLSTLEHVDMHDLSYPPAFAGGVFLPDYQVR